MRVVYSLDLNSVLHNKIKLKYEFIHCLHFLILKEKSPNYAKTFVVSFLVKSFEFSGVIYIIFFSWRALREWPEGT